MGLKYLLDTNVVIDFMAKNLPASSQQKVADIIDDEANISLITKIELLSYSDVEQNVIDFVYSSNVLILSDKIVNKTIELRRKHKKKLPDTIIAATALVNNLTVATRNVTDFVDFDNLSVWNPW
jgi:predicted nucleic acid-binding protein|uniref:Nucleic acid-binding protein n=1 Tax=uncultured bacterium contig00029 TaxID=1181518 RepID=A0A806JYN8_9BACT|nr:nucleic acid-binding protein [uncultured bacterium contig00029]